MTERGEHNTSPVPLPAYVPAPVTTNAPGATVVARACAAAVALIGTMVLAGWVLEVPELRGLGRGAAIAMHPTTALCLVGAAATLWLVAVGRTPRERWIGNGVAIAIVMVAGLRFLGDVIGSSAGGEGLVPRMIHGVAAGRLNTMAPAAALGFGLVAAALLLIARRNETRAALAQVLALVILLLSLVAVLATVYESPRFDTIRAFTRMALPTSIGFALLAIGVLSLRRHSGILAALSSDGPGGTLARGLLPAGFLAPVVLGWLALWGVRATRDHAGAFTVELVLLLLVVAMILVFVGLVAWNATQVHQSHLDRARVEAALRDSEVRFRLLAENGSDVVSLHDLAGRVLYASPSCERVLGFAPEELMAMPPFALTHPDDRARLRDHFDALILGGPMTAVSCRALHKSGQHLWLEMVWRAIVNREGRVVRLQASSRDVTERKDYERQLEDARRKLQANQESLIEANTRLAALATQDPLTGLKNRRAFQDRLAAELTRAKRSGEHVALLLLDIDHFKAFNDSFGHPRGDDVLRLVARVLLQSIRESDLAARYGGEEFAIILPATDRDGALQMGERLREAIEGAVWSDRSITVSVGAAASQEGWTMEDLVDHADRALYRSKQDGRNRVTLSDAA